MGVGVQRRPWPIYPREKPGIPFIGGWVGFGADLDEC